MKTKDWSKVEREIAKEEEEEKANDVDAFFRKIYSNATEEQKRAMIKSFQTSGGTVLSTNWEEVKTADYSGKDRPQVPKSQEWKSFSSH